MIYCDVCGEIEDDGTDFQFVEICSKCLDKLYPDTILIVKDDDFVLTNEVDNVV